jgi:hypothetical protein
MVDFFEEQLLNESQQSINQEADIKRKARNKRKAAKRKAKITAKKKR